MPYNERELLARLIKCEAGGEGDTGMKAVATVVANRANVPYGEFFRVSQGGSIRNIIEQPGQFTCMMTTVGGQYNAQNIYNMDPEEIHYEIADAIIAGDLFSGIGNSLFYFNPFRPTCPSSFPPGGVGAFYSHIYQHCFYAPTEKYKLT
ncbi:cell wall hydrolase [Clostridium merdae]|uniref:cell wall hydrolase n=1 Tax=Clostridium merdae TaxID=1958780 RepID=UPI000A2699CC|nr:cell wall hydrolase [Clostridium merdae]